MWPCKDLKVRSCWYLSSKRCWRVLLGDVLRLSLSLGNKTLACASCSAGTAAAAATAAFCGTFAGSFFVFVALLLIRIIVEK